MESPLNPNFWVCLCPALHSLLEPRCAVCSTSMVGAPYASQQQVNDHAEQVYEGQQLARQARHQLPPQRLSLVPTRAEFEAARVEHAQLQPTVEGIPAFCTYAPRRRLTQLENIIKRYKHHHEPFSQKLVA